MQTNCTINKLKTRDAIAGLSGIVSGRLYNLCTSSAPSGWGDDDTEGHNLMPVLVKHARSKFGEYRYLRYGANCSVSLGQNNNHDTRYTTLRLTTRINIVALGAGASCARARCGSSAAKLQEFSGRLNAGILVARNWESFTIIPRQ